MIGVYSLSSGISRRQGLPLMLNSFIMRGKPAILPMATVTWKELERGGRVMTVRLKLYGVIGFALLILMTSMVIAAPVFAKDMPAWKGSGGMRPVDKKGLPRSLSTMPNLSVAPSEGVIGAFTAIPVGDSIEDAILAGRNIFSTAETIEFDGLLFETGMAGNSVEFWVYLFDIRGQLLTVGYYYDASAPSDKTAFYLQKDAGTTPPGFYKWLMEFHDAFGNYFITPIQTFQVVGVL